MAFNAYIMDDDGNWRLETVYDEIVCGPAYERAQEAEREAFEKRNATNFDDQDFDD